jgi:hypothetical protein
MSRLLVGARSRVTAVAFVVAVVALTLSGCSTTTAPPTGTALHSHRPAVAAAGQVKLADFRELVSQSERAAHALESSPGAPVCAPPALPSPTYPPGHSYGIPFLAEVTNGVITTGYDEYAANHRHWTVGKKKYLLDPWESRLYDISGWVVGLLQLPSLSAVISPRDLVFCDKGGQACVSASPPVGECIHVSLGAAPPLGQQPSNPITNVPPPGRACFGSGTCVPYVIVLTPKGNTTLSVAGVNGNGSLRLSVTTSAITTVSVKVGALSESCTNGVSTVTLGSELEGVPSGGPITPSRGNPDLRGLQIHPTSLDGPLGSATTTLGSNDFHVPAFSVSNCPFLAPIFDAPLGGWNTLSPSDSPQQNNNYFDQPNPPAIAGNPGWVQFSATTTISSFGLPVGPPSGFSLGG